MTPAASRIEFVNEPVEVVRSTGLREAESSLALRVEGELAWTRFLDRIWAQLGPQGRYPGLFMNDRSEESKMPVSSGAHRDSGTKAYLNSTSRSRIASTPEMAGIFGSAVGRS